MKQRRKSVIWIVGVLLVPGFLAYGAASDRIVAAYARPIVDRFVKDARAAYATPDYAAYTNTVLRRAEYARNRVGTADREPWTPGKVRWIDVEGACNIRDIGGWTGLKEGMVFRGSELDTSKVRDLSNPDKAKKVNRHDLTEKGRRVMRDEMRIRCDLDLRRFKGMETAPSEIGPDVRHLVIPISAYTNMLRGVAGVAACLRVFADPENYPVYVHCAGGADRTGSILFLLEGLCGVSEPDLNVEYELTSFGLAERTRTDKPYYFASLVKRMKACPGANLNEQIEWYALNELGLTRDEIASIRRCLTPVRTVTAAGTFELDEDFSVKDEAGGSPSISIERTSALSHAHGAICEGGYTILIDGNRHWLAMPPVADFRLESDYSLYLYKLEFGLGYDVYFRRDPVKGGGHRLRVWWDEHGHDLHVFLNEREVFTGGKLPENLDDLHLVLDVMGTKGVLETVGETITFDIPGEVTSGKVAFDMPYSGSNQITLKHVRLTSDTAPAVTHVKDWKFVLSDEKGMVEPPVYAVALDRYATGESLLTVSLDGMLMGRKPRLESGGREWGKMLERITTPYVRVETAAGEFANLLLWNGRRQYSDPYMAKKKGAEGLTRGAKASDQQWPVRRSYVFEHFPETFTLAAGFEHYMNHPNRFNGGGPFEQVRSYDGTLVFEGESVRKGRVAFQAKSPEDKRIVSKIPKTVVDYDKALHHARRQHYFYETEPVEFTLAAVYRAADHEPDEIDFTPRLETVYREPADAKPVETKRELKPLAEGLVALEKTYRFERNPGVGVWHLETALRGGAADRDERTVFEVLPDDPNGPCPPLASGLPVFMSVPNEIKYREEGAFDPWSDRGGAAHYYAIDDYYPVVGAAKRVWELLPVYRRQWWAQTESRNTDNVDPYDKRNVDLIRHADYVYLRNQRENPAARYDFTQPGSYRNAQLRLLKEFADAKKPAFRLLTSDALARHVKENRPLSDAEFTDLFDTCWEEWIDFARPKSDALEQPFVDYLLSVNPKVGRASYGPMAVYTSAYKSAYWLRDTSMPVERDPRLKANGSFWMFEEYHYSCDYPIYRGSYFVQTYSFLHPEGRRIFPEIYYAGWGGRCNDGAVFQAHPLANGGLAKTHQRKIAYHYAYGSAFFRDGAYGYWSDRGFHARNPEPDTMDEFLHAWGRVVRNEPARSAKAPFVMLDVAELRRHGDYLETESNFAINIGDQHYNGPGDVCNLADEALAYTYETILADGRVTPVVSDLEELDRITPEMAEFVVLPPILPGCPEEKLAAIRRAWERGIALLCFERCAGLEDVFGVREGAVRSLGAVGEEHFSNKMSVCRYDAAGADVALRGAKSQQAPFDVPVVFRRAEGGRRAVFVNVPPSVVRRHTFRGRYTRGQPAISVTMKKAMADAFAFLSPAPQVKAEHGNALAAYTADGSLVVVVCEESPIYRDTNRYPLPFRLAINAPGIGNRKVTSDTPFTVASKSADRLVLRLATEKDTALFFKFEK